MMRPRCRDPSPRAARGPARPAPPPPSVPPLIARNPTVIDRIAPLLLPAVAVLCRRPRRPGRRARQETRLGPRLPGPGHRRQGRRPRQVQGRGAPDRQHRQPVRLHPAVRGAGGGLREVQGPRASRSSPSRPTSSATRSRAPNAEIKSFCTSKYNVTFPLFSKIVVKGEGIHPLYQFLTSKETDPKFAGDDPLELRQVPRQPQGRGDRPVRARRRARVGQGHQGDRGGPGRVEVTGQAECRLQP